LGSVARDGRPGSAYDAIEKRKGCGALRAEMTMGIVISRQVLAYVIFIWMQLSLICGNFVVDNGP